MEKLLFSKDWSDVSLLPTADDSADAKPIPAHCVVLMASSPVFANSLSSSSGFKVESSPVLRINASSEQLRSFLKWMYMDGTRKQKEEWLRQQSIADIMALLGMAHEYLVEPLSRTCLRILRDQLDGMEDAQKIHVLKHIEVC